MQPGNRTVTPNYMAPEVVRRRATDIRLDIFAFGVSMYELFALELPWARGSDGLAAMAHGVTAPPPIDQYCPAIDPVLSAAIMQCIAADPSERFQSMEDFLRIVRRVKFSDS